MIEHNIFVKVHKNTDIHIIIQRLTIIGGGERMGWPILSPLQQIQIHKLVMITVISSYPAYFRIIFLVIKLVFQYINALLADTSKYVSEGGKEWASLFFPP